jgi:hypothetical protein
VQAIAKLVNFKSASKWAHAKQEREWRPARVLARPDYHTFSCVFQAAMDIVQGSVTRVTRHERLRLREYGLTPGSSVNCTIASDDDFVVATLQAPLTGVDVPFDAATGEVLLCPAPAVLKKRPAFTHRVQLIAVEAAAERTLGEYTFVHTPQRK